MPGWIAALIIAALCGLVWLSIWWDGITEDEDGIKALAKKQQRKFPRVSEPGVLEKLKAKSERISRRG